MTNIQLDQLNLIDLISLIQTTLRETDAINKATEQSTSRINQSILRLDDEISRVSCMELRMNQIQEWMREKGAVAVPDGTTLSLSIKQSNNVPQDQIVDVFDAFKHPVVGVKPFAYHIERAYHNLVKLCRREPSLVGASLALCESDGSIQSTTHTIIQSIVHESDNIHRTDVPSTCQIIHRRYIKQLCKCVSRDLFIDELETALCLTQALDRMHKQVIRRQLNAARVSPNGHSSHTSDVPTITHPSFDEPVSVSIADDILEGNSSEPPRLIVHTSLPHSHNAPMSSPISQPFHQSLRPITQSVLDHGSVPIKLLFEYNLQYGSSYLSNVLVGCLNSVLNSDEAMSLDIDLMGPSPTHAQSSPRRSPTSANSATDGQSCEDRLFVVCDQLLTSITSSVRQLPLGIRLLCRKLFELSCDQPIDEVLSKHIDKADASAVMSDPSSPFRVCSDYLFLNWIINAIIHPEHYGLMLNHAFDHSTQSSIHCPSISQSQRRSLQAVSTVMIKLMSGSTFVFDSGRLVVLNDFLDHWRGAIVNFILEVVNVTERSKMVTLSSITTAQPNTSNNKHLNFTEHPVVLLPNDLFCLHGVLRNWYNTTQFQMHESLTEADFAAIPKSVICDLKDVLDQLGDVPDFVGFNDNMYVVISTGVPTLNSDQSLNHALHQAFEPQLEKNLADLLCECLRMVSCIYGSSENTHLPSSNGPGEDSQSTDVETVNLLDCLRLVAVRCELDGQPGAAIVAEECACMLSQMNNESPSSDRHSKLRQFLCNVATTVVRYCTTLKESSLVSSILFLESHLELRLNDLRRRELVVQRSVHSLQIRRVVDIVHLKLRRLKRFMSTRSEKERERQILLSNSLVKSSASPVPSFSPEPSFMSQLISLTKSCSATWPDSLSDDRLLCSACQKSLDKKRTLLRSFYTKYLIGEDVASISASTTKGSAAPMAHPISRSMSTTAVVANANPLPSPPAKSTVGREPGEGHAVLDFGLGDNLDLSDPGVFADLMDAVVASVWTEVRADCARADVRFFTANDALFVAADVRFDVVHALFALNSQHLSVTSIPQIIQALDDHTINLDNITIRLRSLKPPRISETSVARACCLLQQLPFSYSCRDSLAILNAVRSVLTASLCHPALVGSGEVGSVDDYMCLVVFVILRSNPFGLISHIATMQALQPSPCSESKSFVDMLTAVKALLELHGNCDLTPSDTCIQRAARRGRAPNGKVGALKFSASFSSASRDSAVSL